MRRTVAVCFIAILAASTLSALIGPAVAGMVASRSASPDLSDTDARAILGRLTGIWSVRGQSLDANGRPDSELSGTAAYSWSLGGLFLAGEQVLSNGRDMLHSVDFLGYNQAAQQFSRTYLTDRDPANYCSVGLWEPRSKLLTLVTDTIRGPGGSERRIRATLDLSNESQPAWEILYLTGSGADERPVGTVRLVLMRAADPASPGGAGSGAPGMPAPGQGGLTPAQVQQQFDSVLRQKQGMQQQIENMRRQMRDMSDSMKKITQ